LEERSAAPELGPAPLARRVTPTGTVLDF